MDCQIFFTNKLFEQIELTWSFVILFTR